MGFSDDIRKLKNAVENALSNSVSLEAVDDDKAIYDYDKKKEQYYVNAVKTAQKNLARGSASLNELVKHDPSNELPVSELISAAKQAGEETDLKKLKQLADRMQEADSRLKKPPESEISAASYKRKFPEEIRDEMAADLKELEMCFSNSCYRSSIIICGRLLETALHRKYFEETGTDLLEKSPGIGLGKIIAKFDEKKILIDPALKQQIHLINQVRIFSVHKKQEVFRPSKEQTYAIVLYTLDVLGKMFS
ncbi:DUF4145 domain-containing protein [Candidatus Woesearchaeota archaeon]|nr:DUF4145 domain-containing protein [Candidatus Woesearchaeota archaeon]